VAVKESNEAQLRDRIATVEGRIRDAARQAGRDPAEVTIVAVTKGATIDQVRLAVAAGLRDFGENRVQEWLIKESAIGPGQRWHLIGHLQTNKVRYLSRGIAVLHSLDRPGILAPVDARWRAWSGAAAQRGEPLPYALLQVNVAGESSKGGFAPAEVPAVVAGLVDRAGAGVPVRGLMTIAPYVDDAEQVRWVFAALRQLRDEVEASTGARLPQLSMGMSGDYAVAVQEGATMVRVGTAIFGPRS